MIEQTYKSLIRDEHEASLVGRWSAVLTDEFGNIKTQVSGKNVITETGKAYLATFLVAAANSGGTFLMRHIAIGTDATAEAASNTALGAELIRQSGVVSFVSSAIWQVVTTFAAGSGTGAIAEYGLFTSSTSGQMFSRDTESVINKSASDTLTVTTRITIG